MYNKKDFRALFFTKEGLFICYWSVLSLSLLNQYFLVFAVMVSTFLLISWLKYHPRRGVSPIYFFLIGLLIYMIGTPYYADNNNLSSLKIGTAIVFFSRIFLFLHFYFHLHYINYFSLKNLFFVLPFFVSLVFSYLFISPNIPDEVLIFAIPQTFIDALFVSSIPAFIHGGPVKKLYIIVVIFMALFDHLGGYYMYTTSSEIIVFVIRILSALLKLSLTILVFEIDTFKN